MVFEGLETRGRNEQDKMAKTYCSVWSLKILKIAVMVSRAGPPAPKPVDCLVSIILFILKIRMYVILF